MKTSSLPNLNRETISFPTFFSLIQDPDHHDDTTLNKRPKIDNSQYTEASDTLPLKVASPHVNNNNNNDHRALDAASALMDDAESGCGSNSYGGDVEDCSFGSPSRSGYSVSNDGNTSTSRIGFGSPSRSGYSVSNDGNTSTSRISSGSWVHQSFGPNRVPHSFPSLATATQGRDSLVNSEIRSVLDLMRRGEGLRFEDIVILDDPVFFGRGHTADYMSSEESFVR